MEEKKVAILIDADNTSKEYLSTIIEEATKEGIVTYKRIYADWTSPQMQAYKNMLLEHSLFLCNNTHIPREKTQPIPQ